MTSAQLKVMTDAELDELDKEGEGWWSSATSAQLEAMTPDELAEEVWWSAARGDPWRWWRSSGPTDYPVLLVNDETHSLVEWATGHRNFRGVALRPREVAQVVKRLRGIPRLSARGKTVVDSLAESLKQCERTGVVLVQDGPDQDGPDRYYREKIVVHECFHLFQYRKRLQKHSAAKALIQRPSTSKALPSLRKHGYDVDNAVMVVFEMAAYIFSGDHAFIGLERREAEGWLSAYFRQHAVRRAWLGPLKSVPTV